jgi:hypothetical protein
VLWVVMWLIAVWLVACMVVTVILARWFRHIRD